MGAEIEGAPLEAGNEHPWALCGEARRVTSCAYSPRLDKNIGFALVALERAATGTLLETPDGGRRATVTRLPFLDPEKTLVRS